MRRESEPTFRMMLAELMPDEPERQFRTNAYPYLAGFLRARGWKVSWCALGVRYEPTLRYALAPDDLGLLLAEVKRRKPGIIVFNERLRRDQWDDIAAAAGGARLVYCAINDDFQYFMPFIRQHIPEAWRPTRREPFLLDRIEPVFCRRPLNRAPWAAQPLLRVVAGARCPHRTPSADNPFYRRLRLPSRTMGCAFCGVTPFRQPVSDAVAFAARHVAQACRQTAAGGAERRFELIGCELWRNLEGLLAALVRFGARDAELSFSPRIDELLAARGAITASLPRLARSGLSMRILNMGVENFSPAENLRLNKGLSARQVHEAAAFVLATAARQPGHFRYHPGCMSMILFTPWTTLDDLRINAKHMALCPLIHTGCALGGRLQIFPGRPIAGLARHDGLLVKEGDSRFYNAGCITSADQNELPWRFAHAEVALLWRLALGLSDNPSRGALGPDVRAIDAFRKESAVSFSDLLPLFQLAIEVRARHPRTGSTSGLLKLLRRAWPRSASSAP